MPSEGWGLPAARPSVAGPEPAAGAAQMASAVPQTRGPSAAPAPGHSARVGAGRDVERCKEGFVEEEVERWVGNQPPASREGHRGRMLRAVVHETPQVLSAHAAKGIPARFGARVEAETLPIQPAGEESETCNSLCSTAKCSSWHWGKPICLRSPEQEGREGRGGSLIPM